MQLDAATTEGNPALPISPGYLVAHPTAGRAPRSLREVFEYVRADLNVNTGAARVTVALFRCVQFLERARDKRRWTPLRKVLTALNRAWCLVVHVELPPTAECGPGLHLAHGAHGAVLHANASLGRAVHLYPGVTIGMRGLSHHVAVIGDDVILFAHAVLAGAVRVGNNVRVGANVVLTTDLADGERAAAPVPVVRPSRQQPDTAAPGING